MSGENGFSRANYEYGEWLSAAFHFGFELATDLGVECDESFPFVRAEGFALSGIAGLLR